MMNLAFKLIVFANKRKGLVGIMPLLLEKGYLIFKITLYFNLKNHFIIREVPTSSDLKKKTLKESTIFIEKTCNEWLVFVGDYYYYYFLQKIENYYDNV